MRLETGENVVADRAVEHVVQVVDRAEQEGQRQHIGFGNEAAERRDIGAVDVDGANAGLLDGRLFLAELARVEDPEAVPALGPFLDQLAHLFERPDRRIAGRLGVGDAEFARGGRAGEDASQRDQGADTRGTSPHPASAVPLDHLMPLHPGGGDRYATIPGRACHRSPRFRYHCGKDAPGAQDGGRDETKILPARLRRHVAEMRVGQVRRQSRWGAGRP